MALVTSVVTQVNTEAQSRHCIHAVAETIWQQPGLGIACYYVTNAHFIFN